MTIRSFALFTALALAPAAASAQSAPTFVMKAGASDTYEKQSSQLVLQTTHNPRIREFAQMMIRDHNKSTAEVKAAAMRSHVRVGPPMLDAEGRRNVAQLRAAHGTARDRLYVQQQKLSHQKALALHQGYAAHGAAAPLRHAAADIAPVVRTHIAELRAM